MVSFLKAMARVLLPAFILAISLLCIFAIASLQKVNTASFTFLIAAPIMSGMIIAYFRPVGHIGGILTLIFWQTFVLILSIFLAFVLDQEGMICIAMAIAPLLFFTIIGGLIYLLFLRWRIEMRNRIKVTLIPLFAIMLLDALPYDSEIYRIENSVLINAPIEQVFQNLKSIPNIKDDEIETRFSHLLGIPKPRQALWEEANGKMTRHSYWGQDDIHFIENITAYDAPFHIGWTFEFPEAWIKDGIEDPHIELGGKYFNVISGGYHLKELGSQTRLTLYTHTYDGSKLGLYAKTWHHIFFEDFHMAILNLLKTRIEAGST